MKHQFLYFVRIIKCTPDFKNMTCLSYVQNTNTPADFINCSYPEMYSVRNALESGFAPAVQLPSTYHYQDGIVDAYVGYKTWFFENEDDEISDYLIPEDQQGSQRFMKPKEYGL